MPISTFSKLKTKENFELLATTLQSLEIQGPHLKGQMCGQLQTIGQEYIIISRFCQVF